jgi:hypothetical protein
MHCCRHTHTCIHICTHTRAYTKRNKNNNRNNNDDNNNNNRSKRGGEGERIEQRALSLEGVVAGPKEGETHLFGIRELSDPALELMILLKEVATHFVGAEHIKIERVQQCSDRCAPRASATQRTLSQLLGRDLERRARRRRRRRRRRRGAVSVEHTGIGNNRIG